MAHQDLSDAHALELGRALLAIWEDQRVFNLLFRQPPNDDPEMLAKQVRDFTVYTESELHELLRTMQWKQHRKQSVRTNRGHMNDEMADVFKCVLSLAQIIGMTPLGLVDAYWSKTRVVRQRYREEWALDINNPCAIVDIDNVLADYIGGYGNWLLAQPLTVAQRERVRHLMNIGGHLNYQSVEMDIEAWDQLKHEFRSSGGKRHLPCFGGAQHFLRSLREMGLQVVILTSRPIDKYPNILTDTLVWLEAHDLQFDYLWWGMDKAERVLEGRIKQHARLFVDDDPRFIQQMARLNVPSYFLQRGPGPHIGTDYTSPAVHCVRTLTEILDHLKEAR